MGLGRSRGVARLVMAASSLVVMALSAVTGLSPTSRAAAATSSSGVSRLAGPDRYATSVAISKAKFGLGVPVVYIASGATFPDALAGAPAAAWQGGPVLLTAPSSLPSVVATELGRLKPGRIVVLGGTGAVSGLVATALGQYTAGGVTRLSGRDRYATAVAVSQSQFPTPPSTGVPVVYVASGRDFPDALSAAPVAGMHAGPLLLTDPAALPSVVDTELSRLRPSQIVILGGTGAVSSAVEAALSVHNWGGVSRVAGPDRYATAVDVSQSQFQPGVPVAYVASGLDFPDALSGAPVAVGSPLLLTDRQTLPSVVAGELARLQPVRIVVLGGTGAVSDPVAAALAQYLAKPLSSVTDVSANWRGACVIAAGGVDCWPVSGSWRPVAIPGLGSGVTAIDGGGTHSCALTAAGDARCWGTNQYGELGDGTTTSSNTPVAVHGLPSPPAAITAGYHHTCALTSAGGVWCWGYNLYGQLGDGTTTSSTTPVAVQGLPSQPIAISAGGFHTCALTSAGEVWCWGRNDYGELGDGTTTQRETPVQVAGLASAATTIAAGGLHTCALTATKTLQCWGYDGYGELGDGTTTNSSTPVSVTGLTDEPIAITGGIYHTCIATTAGGAECWGYNAKGQLGDGTRTSSTRPVHVVGIDGAVVGISAGFDHTCARTSSGGAWCWGDNTAAQLGDGTEMYSFVPVQVISPVNQ